MAANSGSSRDAAARRRRIMERGSDRLALITGRLQSIPPSPVSPSLAHSHTSDTPPCPQLPPPDENIDVPLNTETACNDVGSDIQPVTRKSEMITEPSAQASFEPTTLTDINPQISTPKTKSQTYLHRTLTPKRLNSAITASQDLRTSSSFIVATLVLLSYTGFPILGSNFTKNIILSRPLFLLLLTNITMVAAPLLLEKTEQRENGRSSTGDTGFSLDHVGKALEWGMMLQTGLRSLLMDCSIYSVVVICGMSFLQKLGS